MFLYGWHGRLVLGSAPSLAAEGQVHQGPRDALERAHVDRFLDGLAKYGVSVFSVVFELVSPAGRRLALAGVLLARPPPRRPAAPLPPPVSWCSHGP